MAPSRSVKSFGRINTSDVQHEPLSGRTCSMTKKRDKVMQIFGERLKAARIEAGFASAEDFARVLGIEGARYRYWERGEIDPGISMMCRICQALDVDANYMLPLSVRRRLAGDDPKPSDGDQDHA